MQLSQKGTFPEILYLNGDEYIMAQTPRGLQIWRNRQDYKTLALPAEGQCFAKFSPTGIIAYRYSDKSIVINSLDGQYEATFSDDIYGNEPILLHNNTIIYQTVNAIKCRQLQAIGLATTWGNVTPKPTGLSRVSASGELIFVDNDRLVPTPNGIRTRPNYINTNVFVCEGSDNNGIEFWHNGKFTHLWPGLPMFNPKIVQTGSSNYIIVAWGDHVGVLDVDLAKEAKMRTPGITIDSYDKKLTSKNNWRLRWHDRNNSGFSGTVEFINGSVHVSFKNPEGEDRSGAKRPVDISGEFLPEQPPLPFPNPPSQGPREWRGNFLAIPGFEYAFMYPAWNTAKRQQFRQTYQASGLTHLPLSPWAKYRDLEYDYSQDPEGFRNVIRELQTDGIHVCVMAFTDGFLSHHPRTRSSLSKWASEYYPQVNSEKDIRLVCTGWEFNQINDSEWTGNGTEHIEWAKTLKSLFPHIPLYVHFSPERITGWPHYPNHDGPQDEVGWWKVISPYVDGLLYQRRPDEDEQEVLDHTIGGNGDVGDASRIAGDYWGLHGKDFVFFEHSRELGRWQRLTKAVMRNSLVKGFC